MIRNLALLTLLIVALPAAAGTRYLNDTIPSCPGTYNPTTATCGGGSASSVATWAELETWLSSDTGPSTIYFVGSTDPADPRWIQLENAQVISLNLSGNQCDAGLTISNDPENPYARIGGWEDANSWAWEFVRPASDDNPALSGNVYRAPAPQEWVVDGSYSRLIEDRSDSINRMITLHEAGTLDEWDDLTGARWRYSISRAVEQLASSGLTQNKVNKYADAYVQNGWLYFITSDGGPIDTFQNGSPRDLMYLRMKRQFLRTEECTDVHLDNVFLDAMFSGWSAKSDTRPKLTNSILGRLSVGYYPMSFGRASSGVQGLNPLIRNNKFVLTASHYTVHRANSINLFVNRSGLINSNVFLMAGGHGDMNLEDANGTFVVGNQSWGAGGKAINGQRESDVTIALNQLQFMQHSWCNYENVPAGSPLGTAGTCPPEFNDVPQEIEGHFSIQADGTRQLVLANELVGRAGGIVSSGRQNNQNSPNEDSRTLHNTFYAGSKGDFLESAPSGNSHGGNPGLRLYDGGTSNYGEITDFISRNDAFLANISRDGSTTTGFAIEYWGVDGDTATARGIEFHNPLISNPLDDGKSVIWENRSLRQPCSTWAGFSEISNAVCTSADEPVAKPLIPGRFSWNVAQPDTTGARHDAGSVAATAVGSGSSATALVVSDIHSFINPYNLPRGAPNDASPINYQLSLAEDINKVMCGEIDCSDPNNPGWVPDAFWTPGGLGVDGSGNAEMFVQIGATRATYCGWTLTTGTQGTLTLCSAQTWSDGDAVHPLPWTGAAPDIGSREFFTTVDALVANDDAFNVAISSTLTLDLCANDVGYGACVGAFEIDPASLSESSPFLSNLGRNAGDTCSVDVDTSATAANGVPFTYALTGTGACAGIDSGPATVTLNITDTAGGAAEQVYYQVDTPVDIMPGANATWEPQDLVASGFPDDAKAINAEVVADSTTNKDWGLRAVGDTDAPLGVAQSNGQSTGIERTDANGDIATYREDATLDGMTALGYFSDTSLVTIDDPPTDVPVTCDGNWNTITQSGLAVYRFAPTEMGQQMAFAMNATTGYRPTVGQYHNIYPVMAENGSDQIGYNCTGSITKLERILTVDESAITLPSDGDFELFTVAATATATAFQPTKFACGGDGCYAYVVYSNATTASQRHNTASTQSELLISGREGNALPTFDIVKADEIDGPFWAASNNSNVKFYVVAAINAGEPPGTIPTVVEVNACAGTAALDGQVPAVTTHGGAIKASDPSVACNNGDIDLPNGQSFAFQTGTGSGQLDFVVEGAAGVLQLAFSYDGRRWYDYANGPWNNQAGLKAALGFQGGGYTLNSNTPGQSQIGTKYTNTGLIPVGGTAYVRVAYAPVSPAASSVSLDLYVSASPITSEDTPIVSGVYSGGVRADNMLVQFQQQNAPIKIKTTPPLTVKSQSQIDAQAPTAPSVTPTVLGQQVTLDFTPPADNGGNVSSYTKYLRVYRDTSPTPTTVLSGQEELDPLTTSWQEVAPAIATYYYRLEFCDSAANCAQTSDVQVTTLAPNTPPTVISPGSTLVPAGANFSSESVVLDLVSLCSASDAEGDPIYVASIETPPADGTLSMRTDSGLVDYTHYQAQTAPDSFVVTFRGPTGGSSAACTVNTTPQLPPFVEPILLSSSRDTSSERTSYMVLMVENGMELQSYDENSGDAFDLYQYATGTGTTSAVTCPRSNPHPCGKLRIYLERDNFGNVFAPMLPVGTGVSVMLVSVDAVSPAGTPASDARGVIIQQE